VDVGTGRDEQPQPPLSHGTAADHYDAPTGEIEPDQIVRIPWQLVV
jgi:hypothetical protein